MRLACDVGLAWRVCGGAVGRWLCALAGLAAAWPMWAGALPVPTPVARPEPSSWAVQDRFPLYQRAGQIDAACAHMLAQARAQVNHVLAVPQGDGAGLLAAWDALLRGIEDGVGPLSLLAAVHPAQGIRAAAEACERSTQNLASQLQQNAALYARLKGVLGGDEIDRRFVREQLDAFEDAGVALPAAAQAQVRRLQTEITRLTQTFERRLREDKTRVAFTEAELSGVPAAVWRRAPRDAQGRYRLGLEAPTSQPVLQQAEREATRERMWRAFISQGGEANLRTLAQIVQRRTELAKRMGFGSYADFVLRRRMALRAAEVDRFLGEVRQAVAERERADIAVLRERKAQATGQPAAVLQRWDVAYYSERVRRERHHVDQEQFRRHFPPEASVAFVFRLAERLFGVRFEGQSAPAPWHIHTAVYTVIDSARGEPLGRLYVDLYPRSNKYNHAAVWSFRNASTRVGRKPAAALVVNFNREGLSLDELETLLHEFGHALHSLLSQTRYAAQGGTNTLLDFVEAPSQMLEDWAYEPRVLALFAEVCPGCAPVPPELLARATAARHFGKGLATARQHLFASYDLALHRGASPSPMALWQQMESATPLGHVPGSQFPAGFAHIAGGYAAGYYGYLWSLVIAEDMRTAFAADRLNASVGQHYRNSILAQGGQAAPHDMLRSFLGRETHSEAFFKALQRQ